MTGRGHRSSRSRKVPGFGMTPPPPCFLASLLLLLLLSTTSWVVAEAQKEVKIGGLFPLTGRMAVAGQQRAKAAQLAVAKINSDPAFLPGVKLTMVLRDTETLPTKGAEQAYDHIQTDKVVALVGAASSGVSKSVALIASIFNIPQVSYSSTAPTLSNKEFYPYFLRVVVPDQVQAQGLVALYKRMGWKRTALISTEDTYGMGAIDKFQEFAGSDVETVVRVTYAPSGSPTSALNAIKASTANVILLNCVYNDCQNVLVEAAAMGLTGKPYTWIATDGWSNFNTFQNAAGAIRQYTAEELRQIKDASKGVVGLKPDERFKEGTSFKSFLTSEWNVDADVIANDWKDEKINTYAPYSYDAVYSVAHAMSKVLEDKGGDVNAMAAEVEDGAAFHAVIKNVSFSGITGQVAFTTEGDRAGDFGVMNSICGEDKWEGKGFWNPNTGFSSLDMSQVQWPASGLGKCRTGGLPPRDAPLPPCQEKDFALSISGCNTKNKRKGTYHWLSGNGNETTGPTNCAGGLALPEDFEVDCPYVVEDSGVGVAMTLITVVGMVLVGLCAFWLTWKMVVLHDKEVKRTQPIFLVMACCGGVLGLGTVFTLLGKPTDLKCNMSITLTSLGIELMYGALITKMLRVDMIFNNSSLKIVVLPTKTMMVYLLRVVALPLLMLVLHLAVDKPEVIHKLVSHGSRVVPEESCKSAGSDDSIFFFVLLVTHVALVVYGALLAFKVRKVQDDFQESKTILMAMYNTLIVALVVLPLVALLDLSLEVRFILVALGCLVGYAGTCLMCLVPKMYKKTAAGSNKVSPAGTGMPVQQANTTQQQVNSMVMQSMQSNASRQIRTSS